MIKSIVQLKSLSKAETLQSLSKSFLFAWLLFFLSPTGFKENFELCATENKELFFKTPCASSAQKHEVSALRQKRREQLLNVKRYGVYYEQWNEQSLKQAFSYDLIITHAGSEDYIALPYFILQSLQKKDQTRLVLAYISIGEDDRPLPEPQKELLGPIFKNSANTLIQGGNGYPSFFMDQLIQSKQKGTENINKKNAEEQKNESKIEDEPSEDFILGQDGLPDTNNNWNSHFVYAGDEQWRELIFKRAHELLETQGYDGLFLDTADTADPDGPYGWSEEAMLKLIIDLRARYPHALLVLNRGFFLFRDYPEKIKGHLDGLMLESLIGTWNEEIKEGKPNPWKDEHLSLYKNYLLPFNQDKDSLFFFFLEYLNPKKNKDLLNDLQKLCSPTHGAFYLAEPALNNFYEQ